jgi:hypothetical protein
MSACVSNARITDPWWLHEELIVLCSDVNAVVDSQLCELSSPLSTEEAIAAIFWMGRNKKINQF